jgi:uncharacterized membrane protein YfcA
MISLQHLLALAAGIPIGFQLGMTGTGGALLAVPLLVYVVGMSVQEAAAISLVVVAVSSLLGAWDYGRLGEVKGRATLAFSWTGIVGAWLGAYGNHAIPKEVFLIAFGVMLLLARWLIVRQRHLAPQSEERSRCAEHFPGSCWLKAAAIGLGVGIINGLFGVGGGFLIVAALVLTLNFPTRLAIGTSLSIIAVIAVAGIAAHAELGAIDLELTFLVMVGSIAGMLFGARVDHFATPKVINRVAASITAVIAFALIVVNGAKLMGL